MKAVISTPEDQEPSVLGLVFKYAKWGVAFVVFLIVLNIVFSCFFTVQQNQVAGVTRNGALISKEPVGPGLHFKLPWVDEAHIISIATNRFEVPKIEFKTSDNQFAVVDVNLTYHVGDPFKTMFRVGAMGPEGWQHLLEPFIQNRAIDVFGKVNALDIINQLANLQGQIMTATKEGALGFYGISIDDVQITKPHYSESFEQNVEKMVQTRNMQISAQNMLVVRETEAKQNVAIAQGQADSAAATADGARRVAIANAEGVAKSTTLQADAGAYAQRQNADAAAYTVKVNSEANAKAAQIVGAAQATAYEAKVKAAGSSEAYADILRAEASKQWTGGVPVYQFGSGSNAQIPIILPTK